MPQSETVPHVDAVFGGKRIRFELQRDRATVDKLEAAVGSVSACWGRFRDGDWTLTDVRTILALAHPSPPKRIENSLHVVARRRVADVARELAMLSGRREPVYPEPSAAPEPRGISIDAIDAVISRHPLATYSILAKMILNAAFFGSFPEDATFDEAAPLIARRAPAQDSA